MVEVVKEYQRICRLLNIQDVLHTSPQNDGSAHLEVVNAKFHYVVTERGSEFERKTTTEKDQLLYWFVSDLVFRLASNYELKNRIQGQSFRRLLFAKEIELMESLNKNWAEYKRLEIEEILKSSPYNDEVEG